MKGKERLDAVIKLIDDRIRVVDAVLSQKYRLPSFILTQLNKYPAGMYKDIDKITIADFLKNALPGGEKTIFRVLRRIRKEELLGHDKYLAWADKRDRRMFSRIQKFFRGFSEQELDGLTKLFAEELAKQTYLPKQIRSSAQRYFPYLSEEQLDNFAKFYAEVQTKETHLSTKQIISILRKYFPDLSEQELDDYAKSYAEEEEVKQTHLSTKQVISSVRKYSPDVSEQQLDNFAKFYAEVQAIQSHLPTKRILSIVRKYFRMTREQEFDDWKNIMEREDSKDGEFLDALGPDRRIPPENYFTKRLDAIVRNPSEDRNKLLLEDVKNPRDVRGVLETAVRDRAWKLLSKLRKKDSSIWKETYAIGFLHGQLGQINLLLDPDLKKIHHQQTAGDIIKQKRWAGLYMLKKEAITLAEEEWKKGSQLYHHEMAKKIHKKIKTLYPEEYQKCKKDFTVNVVREAIKKVAPNGHLWGISKNKKTSTRRSLSSHKRNSTKH